MFNEICIYTYIYIYIYIYMRKNQRKSGYSETLITDIVYVI